MNSCRVERLRLYEFRNYADVVVEFGPGLNVITGRNAQGKTNLLEAVATLTLTRSPRAAGSGDLLRWGSAECQIEARVVRPTGPADLAVRFRRDDATQRVGRVTSMDSKPRPARSLLGVCPVVLFWPDDLQLVKAGPDGRRRLLDVVLSQLDQRVALDLVRYRRSLDQRNALLRQIREGGATTGALAAFDVEFADAAAHVRVARTRLVADLSPAASAALVEVGGAGERLSLAYVADGAVVATGTDADVASVRAQLLEGMARRRNDELSRGISLVGPHRDDIEILLSDRPARASASQGQQRSIVLAIKLAEVRHVAAVARMAPVLVLDDVLSELDEVRRGALLDAVAGAGVQALVTTAEPGTLQRRGNAETAFFEVVAGTVSRVMPTATAG